MMMAREITYLLNDKGQVEEKLAISSPIANVRFALSIFAKASGSPYEFSLEIRDSRTSNKAQQIRNRLTHPRSVRDVRGY